MGKRSVILALILIGTLSGCAASGPPPGPVFASVQQSLPSLAPDKGRVYFFRQHAYGGSLMPVTIARAGRPIGTNYDGSVMYMDFDPGRSEFTLSSANALSIGHATLPIDVVAGQSAFVEIYVPGAEIPLSGGGFASLPGAKPLDDDKISESHCSLDVCGHVVSAAQATPVLGSLIFEANGL